MQENERVVSVRIPASLKREMDKAIKHGIYMNQSDFVRTAIRKLLESRK